jgi:hypothetical protein
MQMTDLKLAAEIDKFIHRVERALVHTPEHMRPKTVEAFVMFLRDHLDLETGGVKLQ